MKRLTLVPEEALGLSLFSTCLFLVLAWPLQLLAAGTESVAVELSTIGISNGDKAENANGLSAEQAVVKLAQEQKAIQQMIQQNFCSQLPNSEPCAKLPNDNTDFSELFIYIFLTQSAQNSFDIFSWQSFIGLNWPLDKTGNVAQTLDDSSDNWRVWSSYKTPREIYKPNVIDPICGPSISSSDNKQRSKPTLKTKLFLQTSGRPLIDRNLNYVVYDVRINPVLEDYIMENGLNTVAGQQAYYASGQEIDYPKGYYENEKLQAGGEPGSIAIKSAWKIIDTAAGDKPEDYFTVHGQIPVAAVHSETGKAFCAEETLGLVGMHIMRRTHSGHGDKWIWSTFEHKDNAPLASNHRRPNDVLAGTLFKDGCKGPAEASRIYAFYNESCPQCKSNTLKNDSWAWAAQKP